MRVLERRTVFRDGEYVAFPNVAWFDGDTLACFFRHAKDRLKEYGHHTHIDPTAKDVFILSGDGGRTFDEQLHVVLDDEMSEQDPCVSVLSDGRLLMSCFRWAFAPEGKGADTWGEALFRRYGRTRPGAYDTFNVGFSLSISDDKGRSWRQGAVIRPEGYIPGSAVRGNMVEMPDGDLLMPFYGVKRIGDLAACGLVRSSDRGETWRFFSEIACAPDKNFLEPSLFRTRSGRLVSLMRTQSDFLIPGVPFDSTYLNLHTAVSSDGGRTFGAVQEVPAVWGSNPFHALQLRSGRVFVSCGYRREPFGIRAYLCDAELEGIAEAPELIVRDDAPNGDLGYTHAVQLKDDTVLLVYYITGEDGVRLIEGAVIEA
jgi:hypothetical protein